VLECTEAVTRHTLPFGSRDRPIYPTASTIGAKDERGLVPADSLGAGLGLAVIVTQAARGSVAALRSRRFASYTVPSRST
jgi:hypothetical protein